EEVVKIDGVAGAQRALVSRQNVTRQGGSAFVLRGSARVPAAFMAAKAGQDQFWVNRLAFGGKVAENFFDRAELLRFVVDDKILFITEHFNVLSQQTRSQRMKR